MKGKSLLIFGIDCISWFCLFLLSIGLGLFVQDIWNDYKAGKTNDRVYTERKNYFNHPTITICFEPQVNETTLLKYNKTVEDIAAYTSKLNLEIPVLTLAEEISFKLGRDFTIGLLISGHESKHGYLGVQINDKNDIIGQKINGTYSVTPFPEISNLIQVEELPLIMYGECTVLKISPKIRGSIQLVNNINLKFKNIEAKNLPSISLFFTSDKNSHGAVWYQWMEGEVFAVNIAPQDDKSHSVSLKQQTRMRLPEISYCSLDLNYYECLNMKFMDLIKSQAQNPCLPVRLASYANIVKVDLKMCQTWEDEQNNFETFMNNYNGETMTSCNASCIQHQYTGVKTSSKRSKVGPNEIFLSYIFPTNEIQVFEEYLMFGVNDLIGTIGGHSGLFIGFSFYGFISTILEYIKSKFEPS